MKEWNIYKIADIVDEIPLNADALIKALSDAIEAEAKKGSKSIEELKKEGLWFVWADMDGTNMYNLDLKGPIGLVIGNEGEGVSLLVKEKCDVVLSMPMKGKINSLNASVAAGILMYEISKQRDT